MPVDAMRLASIDRRGSNRGSADVLPARDWFQMFWIDTRPIAAEMIELESFGDRADHQFVCDPMSGNVPALDSEMPIPAGLDRTSPDAASAHIIAGMESEAVG